MHDLTSKLNLEQKKAVLHTQTPLLVIAGAGSGKTRVITHKIAHLICENIYHPKEITAITFTNKAAQEMQERAMKLLSNTNTRGLNITTFHSLGLKILKQEARHFGYKENFSILDSYDSNKIISEIINSKEKSEIRNLQTLISNFKNNFTLPENLLDNAKDDKESFVADVYRQYQETLKTYQCLDFDDLIKIPVELFLHNPEILYKWQQKIKYLLIDEYQDTNECQYRLIKLLAARGSFTAVGDDDQSIYAWRGAKPENLNILKADFPNLEIVKLEQNYRSSQTILNAANSVIKNNEKLFNKKLWSSFGSGQSINIICAKNDELEAANITRKIRLHQMQNNTHFSDYAILYRGNHQSRVIEQALRSNEIPYTLTHGQAFFDKPEIKDILSYLRLLINEDDDKAFIRAINTPKRGIGQTTLEKLVSYAHSRKISLFEALFEEGFAITCDNHRLNELQDFGNFINSLQYRINKDESKEILAQLLNQIKYEEYLYETENSKSAEKKWGNVLNLVQWINKKSETGEKKLPEIIQNICLISMLDNDKGEEIDSVKLSTLHGAKGLEYPYVYLISCEEGIIPHQESINNDMIDEERRLMYVGITRAMKELTISYCEERRSGGELQTRTPSRFLEEMGEDNIVDESKIQHQKIQDNDLLKDRLTQLQSLLHS